MIYTGTGTQQQQQWCVEDIYVSSGHDRSHALEMQRSQSEVK